LQFLLFCFLFSLQQQGLFFPVAVRLVKIPRPPLLLAAAVPALPSSSSRCSRPVAAAALSLYNGAGKEQAASSTASEIRRKHRNDG
jgi:hypothetical protein